MIFGFNTDVKHGDTIYHVQSEARESEKLLQTQVFVRGRCVGKRAVSYASTANQAGFGDPQKEQQLRDQHRQVLEAIREGKLESMLDRAETETLAAKVSVSARSNILSNLPSRMASRTWRCWSRSCCSFWGSPNPA